MVEGDPAFEVIFEKMKSYPQFLETLGFSQGWKSGDSMLHAVVRLESRTLPRCDARLPIVPSIPPVLPDGPRLPSQTAPTRRPPPAVP